MKLMAYYEIKWKDIVMTLAIPIILSLVFDYLQHPVLAAMMYLLFNFFLLMIILGVFDREFNINRSNY